MDVSVRADPGAPGLAGHFPALDPEPPPRSWRYRAAVAAGWVTAAALIAAVVVVASSAGSSRRAATTLAPSLAASGRIVVQSPATGGIGLSDPDGAHFEQLPALGAFPAYATPAVSPDNRYLLSGGSVIAVGDGRLSIQPTALSLTRNQSTSLPDPFADHDQAAVVLSDARFGETTATTGVSVVALATGRSVSLGLGDRAAGDPQELGAFVTVAGPPLTSVAAEGSLEPDIRVELRDAGRPPVVLATAAALNRLLGQDPNTPVALAAFPDPSGDKVAVTLQRVPANVTAGLVVMDRAGTVIGTVRAASGPFSEPAWSPDGSTLAFATVGSHGAGVVVWALNKGAVTRPVPDPGDRPGLCVWSFDGVAVLCGMGNPQSAAIRWDIAAASGGQVVSVPGPGDVLAWIPAAKPAPVAPAG
jgi:hypothetical protein